jgi:transposase
MEGDRTSLRITEDGWQQLAVVRETARRRQWSAEEKRRIVAESSAPGVAARSVAARYGVHPNLLYAWRRRFGGIVGASEPGRGCGFVPVVIAEPAPSRVAGMVEIELGGAVLRAAPGVEMAFLGAVLRTMRASL